MTEDATAGSRVKAHLASTEGKSRHDYTRAEFVERVWQWKRDELPSSRGDVLHLGKLHLDACLRAVAQLDRDQLPHVARTAQISLHSLHSSDC